MNETPESGLPEVLTVEDERFGPVTITLPVRGAGMARVDGPRLPQAMMLRTGMEQDHPQAPIGTRDAARLTMTVGGDVAGLTLGPGRLTRSSYSAAVDLAGRSYTFEPTDANTSVLRCEGHPVASFTWIGDSEPEARRLSEEAASPTPEEVAAGYLLATAFGTGAASTGSLVVDAILQMIPGA
ncbi:hypothetical protein [Streptomyces sp. SYSU K217416]